MTKMKYIQLLIVSLLLLAHGVMGQGLVAHYPLDNDLINDISGNAFDGTQNVVFATDGRFGEAQTGVFFRDANNSFAQISHNDLLAPSSFTINIWYDPFTVNGTSNPGGFLITKGSYYRIQFDETNTDNLIFSILDGNNVLQQIRTGQGAIRGYRANGEFFDRWYMATLSYNDATRSMKAYLDGELIGETILAASPVDADASILLGSGSNTAMDDVRIYDGELSQAEITTLFQDELFPAFSMDQQNGNVGTTINFTNSSISSTTIDSYSWDFARSTGAESTVQNPSFTYDFAGTFDVALTVTSGTKSRTIVKNGIISIIADGQSTALNTAEYFFDNDPGLGNGVSIMLDQAGSPTLEQSFEIDLTGLSTGFHTLFVRTQNDVNRWSIYEGRTFFVQPQAAPIIPATGISNAEYFFDTDPGIGNGVTVNIENPTSDIEQTFDISLIGQSTGFHTLFYRVQDDLGKWSLYEGRTFFIQAAPDLSPEATAITAAEFFFDTDPGIGNGSNLAITTGAEIEESLELAIENLPAGFHNLFIRVQDDQLQWSTYEGRSFFVQEALDVPTPATAITAAEFFFDNDPGIGLATSINLTATNEEIEEQIAVASTGLTIGIHQLFIRVKDDNGVYSIAQNRQVAVTNGPLSNGNTLGVAEDEILTFLVADLNYESESNTEFTRVRIDQVPTTGILRVGNAQVFTGEELSVDNIEALGLSYLPNANFNGFDQFEYTVGDADNLSIASTTMNIDITALNDEPAFTISGNLTLEVDFTTTESILVTPEIVPEDERDQIVVYSLSPESVDFANVVIDENTGEVTINRVIGGIGLQEFTITANDGQVDNNEFSQTFTLTVGSAGPFSNGSEVTIEENGFINLASSDFNYMSGANTPFTRLRIETLSANGILSDINGEITAGQELVINDDFFLTFDPNFNFNGNDSFSFSVGDNTEFSEQPATFSIIITPVNSEPIFELNRNEVSLPINFPGTEEITIVRESGDIPDDEVDQTITYRLSPTSVNFANVNIDVNSGTVSITSVEGAAGQQVFEVIADDGQDVNNISTESFELTISTDGPFSFGNSFVIAEDDTQLLRAEDFNFTNSTDAPFSRLILETLPANGNLFETDANGNITGTQPFSESEIGLTLMVDGTRNIAYVPNKDYNGNDAFTYAVGDDNAFSSNPASISFDITPINDQPFFEFNRNVVALPINFTTTETIEVMFDEEDRPADEASETVTYSLEPSIVDFANVSIDSNTGTVTITRVIGGFGNQTFSVTADDGQSINNLASNEFTLTVFEGEIGSGGNTLVADEDSNITISAADFNFTSSNNDEFSRLRIESLPENGDLMFGSVALVPADIGTILSIDPNFTLTFVPAQNYNGITSFDYSVGSASVFSMNPATLTLEILAINDAPTFTLSESVLNLNVDFTEVVNITVTADDIPNENNDELTYSLSPAMVDFADVAIDPSTGLISISSRLGLFGSQEFTVTADDGFQFENNIATATFTLNVMAENLAPIIDDQTLVVEENAINGLLIGNIMASDPNGDALTFTISDGNINDAFVLDAMSGNLSVANTDALDFETTPVFNLTVTVSDASLSAQAIVRINLTDVDENNAPIIANQSFEVNENSDSGTLVGQIVASDEDGDALTFTIIGGNTNDAFNLNPENGNLTVNNQAAIDIALNPSFNLEVSVSDGSDESMAVVTITINELITSVVDLEKLFNGYYPNPTREYLFLKENISLNIQTISVYDLSGKLVKRISEDFEKIRVNELVNGTYQLIILDQNGQFSVQRFIKN